MLVTVVDSSCGCVVVVVAVVVVSAEGSAGEGKQRNANSEGRTNKHHARTFEELARPLQECDIQAGRTM